MSDQQQKSMPETAADALSLTRDYVRQETIDPLKGVTRYLGYGGVGVLFGSIGVILLMLAGLRLLQTQTGSTFQGNLSWIPYLIVLVVAAACAGYAVMRISRK